MFSNIWIEFLPALGASEQPAAGCPHARGPTLSLPSFAVFHTAAMLISIPNLSREMSNDLRFLYRELLSGS